MGHNQQKIYNYQVLKIYNLLKLYRHMIQVQKNNYNLIHLRLQVTKL